MRSIIPNLLGTGTNSPIRRIVIALALATALCAAPGAHSQGSRKDDIVFNAQGRPMAGAAVRVCTASATGQPCSPLANIYSDSALSQALSNPTATDGLGNYTFYAAPGRYMIEISGPGITTKQIPNVILPNDPSAPTFTSLTTTSGISAFSLSLSGNLTVNGSTAVTGTLTVGGAPVASTGQANTWSAPQTFSNTYSKGPQPWIDLSAVGGNVVTAAGEATASCVSGNAHITAGSSSYDFIVGDGVALTGCSAAPSTTVPAMVAVTPGGITGATTYHYKVVGIDANHGYSAASSDATTATGNATLSFVNYNLVTWTCNSAYAGYVVYGAKGAAALTQIGYVDDCQYADTGYQYHTKLTMLSFPTNPPTVAHTGFLFTTVSAISGTDYTLADTPTASASGIRMIHDGNKPMINALATMGAIGGGVIRVCIKSGDQMYFGGLIPLTQNKITIESRCGGGPIATYDNVPLFRVTQNVSGFSLYGGSYGSILSVNQDGNLNQQDGGIISQVNYNGPWGLVFMAGQSYNLTVDHSFFGGEGNMFEFAPNSLIYNFSLDTNWFQSNQTCSFVFHRGNGNNTHDWLWKNNTFEGFSTQQCPGQAGVELGEVNGFEEDNDVTSDFPGGAVVMNFLHTGPGAGQTGTGITRYTCVNCDFAVGNAGSVFTSAFFANMTLINGEFVAAGGGKVIPTGCIYDLTIVGVAAFSPAYDPTTNTCGPTTAINATAIDGYPNSGVKVFADTTGALLFDAGHSFKTSLATKSSAYTLTASDAWVNVTGTTTITVPHAVVGQRWVVFNSGSNTVTVQADSGNINGGANVTLAANTGKDVTCDGTNCFAH